MHSNQERFLVSLGWNSILAHEFETLVAIKSILPTSRAGRVVSQEKDRYRVWIQEGEPVWAHVRGRLLHRSLDSRDLPVVGDWVCVEFDSQGESARIEAVLPRQSFLARKPPEGGIQPIAANIQYVLIATSLNLDLNFARLDRYLTLAWDSSATPVLVLTKRDLSPDWPQIMDGIQIRYPFVDSHAVCAEEASTLDCLHRYLTTGRTVVIVGSSGVGKSTLINALSGQSRAKTSEIRANDEKGRHTTTSRFMWGTLSGGWIIDTPGMRELQMLDNDKGLMQSFSDLYELFGNCRFRDCHHDSEPGCAVQEALAVGELDPERWKSFLKIQKEVNHQLRKRDKVAASAEKEKWKKIHKDLKLRLKHKKT